ncbi:MAG: hypothetical protein F6J98_30155 [Moorea sp. SIO4G2]|nr:hypothetical protein [Moorena sp. SIO4G2]
MLKYIRGTTGDRVHLIVNAMVNVVSNPLKTGFCDRRSRAKGDRIRCLML